MFGKWIAACIWWRTQGSSVQGLPELFSQIGAKTIADIIPITMLAFLVIAVILHYILDYTALGFKIYMFGSNSVAAEYSGINNTAVVILTYTIAHRWLWTQRRK